MAALPVLQFAWRLIIIRIPPPAKHIIANWHSAYKYPKYNWQLLSHISNIHNHSQNPHHLGSSQTSTFTNSTLIDTIDRMHQYLQIGSRFKSYKRVSWILRLVIAVVIITQTLTLLDLSTCHQQNQRLTPKTHFDWMHIFLFLTLTHTVQKSCYVCPFVWANHQRFLWMFAVPKIHHAVIFMHFLQINTFSKCQHLPNILAYDWIFRNIHICDHIHSLLSWFCKPKWADGLRFVEQVLFLLFFAHICESEVHTLR